ncbi:alpha/beta hydrolase [Streptomyces sp. NPDC055078]
MQLRRIAPLLAVSVLVPLVPAVAVSPAAAVGPLDAYARQRVVWQRCGTDTPASFQCATVKVPLDYARPGGERIDVAISRIRTGVPGKRRGVLLLNPGGPGGPGLNEPLEMGALLPRAVKDRYDLIGFDPRGVGRGSLLDCSLTLNEMGSFDRPYRAETFAGDVAWAKGVADKCRAKEGERLRHFTTRNTARDMDLIRAVLGEKKISYVGFSYGTYLGAVYTQLFPRRADRIVLDSAVDPDRVWRGFIRSWAEGTEPAFVNWSRWTARRAGVYGLGDTPAQVRETFWELVARADRTPIEIGGQRITGDDIRAESRLFFSVREAAEQVAALKRAAGRASAPAAAESSPDGLGAVEPPLGDPAAVKPRLGDPAAAEPPVDDPGAQATAATAWSIFCGDDSASWPGDPERYRRDAVRARKSLPLYGDFVSTITPCAFWPKSAEPVTAVRNTVPALIIQNEWDPATTLPSALGAHRALKGSKLVTVRGGEGHGVYRYAPNACAVEAADTYLATGRLPARDLVCRADPAEPADPGGPADPADPGGPARSGAMPSSG